MLQVAAIVAVIVLDLLAFQDQVSMGRGRPLVQSFAIAIVVVVIVPKLRLAVVEEEVVVHLAVVLQLDLQLVD